MKGRVEALEMSLWCAHLSIVSNLLQYNKFCLNILQLGWVPEEDVRFIFLNLAKELSEGSKNGTNVHLLTQSISNLLV